MKTEHTNQNSSEYIKEYYAALMLIKQLYIDGIIPKHVYNNIYNEYHEKCA